MNSNDDIRKLIYAYIAPRYPSDDDERAAVEAAVGFQRAFEAANEAALGSFAAVGGISAMSNGGVALKFNGRSLKLDEQSISPLARAVLLTAGLLDGDMPVARRIP